MRYNVASDASASKCSHVPMSGAASGVNGPLHDCCLLRRRDGGGDGGPRNIFPHFCMLFLKLHSLSLCCPHTIKTSHSVGSTGKILRNKLTKHTSFTNFYVCCDKQQQTRTQLMHRPTLIKCSPRNVKIVPTPLVVPRTHCSLGSLAKMQVYAEKTARKLLTFGERWGWTIVGVPECFDSDHFFVFFTCHPPSRVISKRERHPSPTRCATAACIVDQVRDGGEIFQRKKLRIS